MANRLKIKAKNKHEWSKKLFLVRHMVICYDNQRVNMSKGVFFYMQNGTHQSPFPSIKMHRRECMGWDILGHMGSERMSE
jgi:hypothetical protein